MFAYILKAPGTPTTEETNEFFRRFTETPGLIHAFDLEAEDGENEGLVVAVWESREAADRYLDGAPLRREVDKALPAVTRTMYRVLNNK